MAVTLAATLFAALDGGWLAHWCALAPARVWHGELWRLVTWPFIERSPLGLVFTLAAIYKFGGELAPRWGDRRLRRFALDVVVGAGLATVIVALAFGATHVWRLGGWAVTEALVIAWARQYPDRGLVFYGFLALRGRQIVRLTFGVAVLFVIFAGTAAAPELAACAIATWYPPSRLR